MRFETKTRGVTDRHNPCSIDDICDSGENIPGRMLYEGDVIEFPQLEEMKFWMYSFKEGVKPTPYITASVNNEAYEAFPIGILRRKPANYYMQAFFSNYPVNREIYEMQNDSERAKALAGRKLKVTKLIDGYKDKWITTDSGRAIEKDNRGNEVTTPTKFCIFEWVD